MLSLCDDLSHLEIINVSAFSQHYLLLYKCIIAYGVRVCLNNIIEQGEK